MNILSIFAAVSKGVRSSLGILGSIGVFLMVATIVPDVLGRYLFNHPIMGVLEFNELLIVAVVFLPLARIQAKRANVRVGVLVSRLPARLKPASDLYAWLIGFAFYAWMAKATTIAAIRSIKLGEFSMGLVEFPLWPGKVAMALGVSLLCVQLAVDIVGEVRAMLRGVGSSITTEGKTEATV